MTRLWRPAYLVVALLVAVAIINVSASPRAAAHGAAHGAAHPAADMNAAQQQIVPLGGGGGGTTIQLVCVMDPGAAGGCRVPSGLFFRGGCTTTASILISKDSLRWVPVSTTPSAYCIGSYQHLDASHGTVSVADESW